MVKTETFAILKAIQFQDTGATCGYCHAVEKGGKCIYMTEFFNDYITYRYYNNIPIMFLRASIVGK